jgi:hypothetical protein
MQVPAAVAQEWDLTGEWVIDLDESDDPVEIFDGVSQARRGQSGVRVRYSNLGTADYRPDAVLEDDKQMLHSQWRRDMFTIVRDVGEDLHATEQFYLDRSDPNRLRWLVSIELS